MAKELIVVIVLLFVLYVNSPAGEHTVFGLILSEFNMYEMLQPFEWLKHNMNLYLAIKSNCICLLCEPWSVQQIVKVIKCLQSLNTYFTANFE